MITLPTKIKTRKQRLKWRRRLRRQYDRMVQTRNLVKRVLPKYQELEAAIHRNNELLEGLLMMQRSRQAAGGSHA